MRLICNSIPKSGTYLLGAIADFCQLQDSLLRFVDTGTNVVDANNNLVRFDALAGPEKLTRLTPGQYAPSHLTYSPGLAEFVLRHGFRHLFIYRHPYDILYSYVRFVTYSKSFAEQDGYNAALQNSMKSGFASDEERICHVFQNMGANFNFQANLGWLDSNACHAVRFEDLYGDLVALRSGTVGEFLKGVFDYIGFGAEQPADAIHARIYGVGPTFMKGEKKVGQFLQLDRDKLAPVLDDLGLKDAVRRFGYSPDPLPRAGDA